MNFNLRISFIAKMKEFLIIAFLGLALANELNLEELVARVIEVLTYTRTLEIYRHREISKFEKTLCTRIT